MVYELQSATAESIQRALNRVESVAEDLVSGAITDKDYCRFIGAACEEEVTSGLKSLRA